ncbi:hypothetical protein OK006_8984 [Actinobacteria bacterium OK006]|nr:hypothetical protein OK006_8984 [Actinobacteria bacterium OK006]
MVSATAVVTTAVVTTAVSVVSVASVVVPVAAVGVIGGVIRVGTGRAGDAGRAERQGQSGEQAGDQPERPRSDDPHGAFPPMPSGCFSNWSGRATRAGRGPPTAASWTPPRPRPAPPEPGWTARQGRRLARAATRTALPKSRCWSRAWRTFTPRQVDRYFAGPGKRGPARRRPGSPPPGPRGRSTVPKPGKRPGPRHLTWWDVPPGEAVGEDRAADRAARPRARRPARGTHRARRRLPRLPARRSSSSRSSPFTPSAGVRPAASS